MSTSPNSTQRAFRQEVSHRLKRFISVGQIRHSNNIWIVEGEHTMLTGDSLTFPHRIARSSLPTKPTYGIHLAPSEFKFKGTILELSCDMISPSDSSLGSNKERSTDYVSFVRHVIEKSVRGSDENIVPTNT